MAKIRFKLSFMITLSLLICAGASYLCYHSFSNLENINSQIMQTSEVEGALRAAANSKFYRSINRSLRAFQGKLVPSYRNQLMDKIIRAHDYKNRRNLNLHIENFRKQEKNYIQYLKDNKEVYYARLLSATYVLALTYLMTVFLISLYTHTAVFRPLKSLSKRMIDFLNNRYTYQFRVPKPNEVGELELNFHSLAQRVLNNIEELKALDSAKSDFLNIASHELRTPLTSIKGSLSLLKSGVIGEVNEKTTQLIGIAETETDRLIRLINDLLDLAKIEAGKLPLQRDWVTIDGLVEKTLYSLAGLSATANVKLKYETGQNILVEIDQDRIQQVITNLASNAIKYSPKEGTVKVQVTIDSSNHVRVAISDQGKGISPEDQQLIFQKFRQATGPQNPIVKGTGLGLAIAKAVIEEHEGTIGVHSRVGEGSTFYFTLPDWKPDSSNNKDNQKEENTESTAEKAA